MDTDDLESQLLLGECHYNKPPRRSYLTRLCMSFRRLSSTCIPNLNCKKYFLIFAVVVYLACIPANILVPNIVDWLVTTNDNKSLHRLGITQLIEVVRDLLSLYFEAIFDPHVMRALISLPEWARRYIRKSDSPSNILQSVMKMIYRLVGLSDLPVMAVFKVIFCLVFVLLIAATVKFVGDANKEAQSRKRIRDDYVEGAVDIESAECLAQLEKAESDYIKWTTITNLVRIFFKVLIFVLVWTIAFLYAKDTTPWVKFLATLESTIDSASKIAQRWATAMVIWDSIRKKKQGLIAPDTSLEATVLCATPTSGRPAGSLTPYPTLPEIEPQGGLRRIMDNSEDIGPEYVPSMKPGQPSLAISMDDQLKVSSSPPNFRSQCSETRAQIGEDEVAPTYVGGTMRMLPRAALETSLPMVPGPEPLNSLPDFTQGKGDVTTQPGIQPESQSPLA
ncbi:hypothetical protein BGZ63DRAFT_468188 [Mariannaea sp. PMI_226]|nr:hypothetical protein BGZ63DRAFT_468188 [Mariannaea sp. PMI_226]